MKWFGIGIMLGLGLGIVNTVDGWLRGGVRARSIEYSSHWKCRYRLGIGIVKGFSIGIVQGLGIGIA